MAVKLLDAIMTMMAFLVARIADIFCLLLFCFSLIGVWRWPFLCEPVQAGNNGEKVYRTRMLFNFAAVLVDVAVFPLFVFVMCSWRCVGLVKELVLCDAVPFYTMQRRTIIATEFVLLIRDFPFAIMFVLVHCFAFWRIPSLWSELLLDSHNADSCLYACEATSRSSSSDSRRIIARNTWRGLVDVLLSPFAVCVLLTVYRIPTVFRNWSNPTTASESLHAQRWALIMRQFALVCVDIPHGLIGALVLCTWRCVRLARRLCLLCHRDVQDTITPGLHVDDSDCDCCCDNGLPDWLDAHRRTIREEFMNVMVDIPVGVIFILLHLCVWRVGFVWADLVAEMRRVKGCPLLSAAPLADSSCRVIILVHCGRGLIDVVLAPIGCLVFVTIYRLPVLCQQWALLATDPHEVEVDEVVVCGDSRHWRRWQVVCNQCLEILVDLPHMLMLTLLLCSWRSVRALRQLVCSAHSSLDDTSRGSSEEEHGKHEHVAKTEDASASPSSYRTIIRGEAFALLIDVPHVMLMLLCCVCVWRLPFLIFDIMRLTQQYGFPLAQAPKEGSTFRDTIRHNSFCGACDILLAPVGLFVGLTLYRVPVVLNDWKSKGNPLSHGQRWLVVCQQAMQVLVDIPFHAMAILLFCSWRSLSLLRRLCYGTAPDIECNFAPCTDASCGYTCARRITADEFIQLICDLPAVVCLLLAHVLPWRAVLVYRELLVEWRREIGPASGAPKDACCSGALSAATVRHILLKHATRGLIDVVLLPFAVVVLCTAYRVPIVLRLWSDISKQTKTNDGDSCCESNHARRWGVVCDQFGELIFDMILVAFALVAVVFPWRLFWLFRDIKHVMTAQQASTAVEQEDPAQEDPATSSSRLLEAARHSPQPAKVVDPESSAVVASSELTEAAATSQLEVALTTELLVVCETRPDNRTLEQTSSSSKPSVRAGIAVAVVLHAVRGCMDLLMVPFATVIAITVYRLPETVEQLVEADKHETIDDDNDRCCFVMGQYFTKCGVVFRQCAAVLIDLPFILCGALTLLLLIRAYPLVIDLRSNSSGSRRRVAAVHLLLSFRDWLCAPFLAVVLASVYRGYILIVRLRQLTTSWADPEQKITVTSAKLHLPEAVNERGFGVILNVTADMHHFALARNSCVRLHVRNPSLWAAVETAFGSSAALVAQSMMPLKLTPKFLSVDSLCGTKDQTVVSFAVDFAIPQAKCRSIRKWMSKLASAGVVDLQFEYDVSAEGPLPGTLFSLGLQLDQFSAYCDGGAEVPTVDLASKYDASCRLGQRLSDVWWKTALIEFGALVFDVIGTIATCSALVLLLLFPHRLLQVFTRAGEGPLKRELRRRAEVARCALVDITDGRESLQHYLLDLDRAVKQRLLSVVSSSEATNNQNGLFLLQQSIPETGVVVPIAKDLVLQYDTHIQSLKQDGFGTEAAELDALVLTIKGALACVHESYRCHFENDQPFCKIFDLQDLVAPGSSLPNNVLNWVRTQPHENGSIELPKLSEPSENFAQPLEGSAAPREISMTLSAEPSVHILQPGPALDLLQRHHDQVIHVLQQTADAANTEFVQEPCSWRGVQIVILNHFVDALKDIPAMICAGIVVATVYRITPLVIGLRRSTGSRRSACYSQLLEILVDISYVVKVVFLALFPRSIIFLPADLWWYVSRRPTFATARRVIDEHIRWNLHDVFVGIQDLSRLVLSVLGWDTVRFAAAAAVFGIFSPSLIFESAFARWSDDEHEWSVPVAATLLLFSTGWLVGVPAVIAGWVGPNYGTQNFAYPASAYFCSVGLVVVAGAVAALYHREPSSVSTHRCKLRSLPTLGLAAYVQGTHLFLDFVQWNALAFGTPTYHMYGDRTGDVVFRISQYVYGVFGESSNSMHLSVGAWVSIATMILFFMVSGAPVVCGNMLGWRSAKDIFESPAWILAIEFSGRFMFLTVVKNVALLFDCQGNTCWTADSRRPLIAVVMVLFAYWLSSTTMKNQNWTLAAEKYLTVVFPALYRCLTALVAATTVIVVTLVQDSAQFKLGFIAAGASVSCAITFGYNRIFGHEVCSVKSFEWFKTILFATCAANSVILMAHHSQASCANCTSWVSSCWSLVACGAMTFAMIAAALACSFVLSRPASAVEDTLDDAKQKMSELLLSVARLPNHLSDSKRDCFSTEISSHIHSATTSGELALALLDIEDICPTLHLSTFFLALRRNWRSRLLRCQRSDGTRRLDVFCNRDTATDDTETVVSDDESSLQFILESILIMKTALR